MGGRAFQLSGPSLWNNRPVWIQKTDIFSTFKIRLEIFLFDKAYSLAGSGVPESSLEFFCCRSRLLGSSSDALSVSSSLTFVTHYAFIYESVFNIFLFLMSGSAPQHLLSCLPPLPSNRSQQMANPSVSLVLLVVSSC